MAGNSKACLPSANFGWHRVDVQHVQLLFGSPVEMQDEMPRRGLAHSLLRVSCSGAKALALGNARYTSSRRSWNMAAAPANRPAGLVLPLPGSCRANAEDHRGNQEGSASCLLEPTCWNKVAALVHNALHFLHEMAKPIQPLVCWLSNDTCNNS